MGNTHVTLFRKQLVAALGAIPAMATVVLTWHYAPQLFAFVKLPTDDIPNRLAFVAHWLTIPGLTLLAGIMGAGRRGFMDNAIDGTRTPASWSLEINLRYNQNTLEQVTLAAIAWVGLALAVPRENLITIPALAFLFGLGRITFWIGYVINPLARAFGMTMTALPTVAAYVWLATQLLD